jgi:hypothetical protein
MGRAEVNGIFGTGLDGATRERREEEEECSYSYIKGAVRACTRFSLSVRSVVVFLFLSTKRKSKRKKEKEYKKRENHFRLHDDYSSNIIIISLNVIILFMPVRARVRNYGPFSFFSSLLFFARSTAERSGEHNSQGDAALRRDCQTKITIKKRILFNSLARLKKIFSSLCCTVLCFPSLRHSSRIRKRIEEEEEAMERIRIEI